MDCGNLAKTAVTAPPTSMFAMPRTAVGLRARLAATVVPAIIRPLAAESGAGAVTILAGEVERLTWTTIGVRPGVIVIRTAPMVPIVIRVMVTLF